jgi:integrase
MAILTECPVCHKKQSIKNKRCACGTDLDKEKRNRKVSYHIVYRVNGKQKWRALSSFEGMDPCSLDDARDVEARFRVAKRENKLDVFDPKPEYRMTFKELSEWYLGLEKVKALSSYETIKIYLNKFNRDFGNALISGVKPVDLENHQEKRKREGLKPKTIDDEINYVKTMIIKAFDNDLIGGDTLKTFKRTKRLMKGSSNARNRVLTVEEFDRLLPHALSHLRDALRIGYWTGMREGEILNLTWDKIDLRARTISLEAGDTKEGKAKTVPIGNEVLRVLTKGGKVAGGMGYVVTYNGKPITRHFYASLKTACNKAKIPYGRETKGGFVFHDLRHTFVTDMDEAGVPQAITDSITGHSGGGMHGRYSTPRMDRKREAVRELEAYRQGVRQSVSSELPQNL